MLPQSYGSYTLVHHLATGGMGELYVAQRGGVAGFSKQVVVKRLRDDLAEDDEFVEMFLDEGRLAAVLDHANIVHVYELGEAEDSYFMAMEYVHGIDLGSLLQTVNGPLDLTVALYVMRNVCEGLAFAHDALDAEGRPLELVHRDINPANILLSQGGAVKIADFGIAKVAQRHRQTRAGVLKGKFGYLSPEQARGQRVDRRCDIYALGLLLFEMTTGQTAIPDGPEGQMLEAAAHGMLRQPQEVVVDYPRPLGDVFRRCTAWNPDDRYQAVPELLDELLEFQMDQRLMATPKRLSELVSYYFGSQLSAKRRALTPAKPGRESQPVLSSQGLAPTPTTDDLEEEPATHARNASLDRSAPPDLAGDLWGLEGEDEVDTVVQREASTDATRVLGKQQPAAIEAHLTDELDAVTTSQEVVCRAEPSSSSFQPASTAALEPGEARGFQPASTAALAPDEARAFQPSSTSALERDAPLSAKPTGAIGAGGIVASATSEPTIARYRLADEPLPGGLDAKPTELSQPLIETTRKALPEVTDASAEGLDDNSGDQMMYAATALFETDAPQVAPHAGPLASPPDDTLATMARSPRSSIPRDRPAPRPHQPSSAPKPRAVGKPRGKPRWALYLLLSLLILLIAVAAGYLTRMWRQPKAAATAGTTSRVPVPAPPPSPPSP